MKKHAAIKIAFIGSLDSGKSTLIASMVNAMTCGLQGGLQVLDFTDYIRNNHSHVSLSDVGLRIIDWLERTDKSPFVMQCNDRSPNINQYDLRVSFPDQSKKFAIQLIDIPGSMLHCSSLNYQYIINILQDCDTIVVVVDTPYLMHEKKVVRQLGNNMQEVCNTLTNVLPSTNRDMQIIFAPVKCEKWVHNGAINEVVAAVLEEYSSVITMLGDPNVEVSVIPTETVGAVEFYEFRKDYVLFGDTNSSMKLCSLVPGSNKLVALYNGKVVEVQDSGRIIENINTVFYNRFGGSMIEKPVGWYEKSRNINEYHPQNCEQVVLHSVRFVFDSILRRDRKYPFGKFFHTSLIGTLSSEDMEIVLNRIKYSIKDEVEGIVTVKFIGQ